MAMTTETVHDLEFLEGEGLMSNLSMKTVPVMGVTLPAGKVLGFNGTNWVEHDPGAVDGSENAGGVLGMSVDSATPVDGLVVMQDARVNGHLLTWITGIAAGDKTAGEAALLALNIRVEY